MSEYTATPSTGKLKLKGVQDSRVDKKKKKKKAPTSTTTGLTEPNHDAATTTTTLTTRESEPFDDKSVVLRHLADDEDAKLTRTTRRDRTDVVDGKDVLSPGSGVDHGDDDDDDDEDIRTHLKTEAEKRYDDQRRKRLEDRLKREGGKTHKERVEDLNRYLSALSEHHDMPKIGPG